jgi:3-hydroxyisobutyrate dehydrogenase-like beta-hydroxyacid dehydrogenase
MGLAMALNIQRHIGEYKLPALRYSNRTLSRGEPLEKIGGVPCQSVAELTQSCDIIFISVRAIPSILCHIFIVHIKLTSILGQR